MDTVLSASLNTIDGDLESYPVHTNNVIGLFCVCKPITTQPFLEARGTGSVRLRKDSLPIGGQMCLNQR